MKIYFKFYFEIIYIAFYFFALRSLVSRFADLRACFIIS